ncbi:MAG: aldo/keto reductase [Clostridia bacterium]
MSKYLGEDFKKLGFGFMRLPMIEEGVIDMEQTCKMVDHFMDKGFTYFDTAYVYIGGKSEVALKESLIDRYPRESFQIASKLPMWEQEDYDMDKIFNTTMERLGTDYIDFYLLHALNAGTAKRAEEIGGWDYIAKKKAEGKIKHIGFSFHDKAEVLDDILTKHPEAEFVQLQINYIDWDNNDVQSKLCYEVALKHNKPIIVMEPVKGGTLASVTPKAEEIFKASKPELSTASWAVRFAASLENIVTVLSGMSDMAQLQDNVAYMENFEPLTDSEKTDVKSVVDIINQIPLIPCTDCKYCVDGCPMSINIPALFSAMNHHKKFDPDQAVLSTKNRFDNAVKEKELPSACIACGACEDKCPQKIEIIKELADIAAIYEN